MTRVTCSAQPAPLEAEWPSIDPVRLERVRDEVVRLTQTTNSLDGLDIEPNAPPEGMPFAIIASVPLLPEAKRQDRQHWRRCSYCERNMQFAHGKILFGADGRLRLIGDDCWKRHISNLAWGEARDDHAEYQRKVRFTRIQTQFPRVLDRINASVAHLIQQPECKKTCSSFPGSFASVFPQLVADMAECLKRHQGLGEIKRVTRYSELEGRAGQRLADREDGTGPSSREEFVLIHAPVGLHALTEAPTKAFEELEQGRAKIWAALRMLRDGGWEKLPTPIFTKKFKELEAYCRSASEQLNIAVASINAIQAFMDAKNLRGIALWANQCEPCLYGTYVPLQHGLRYIPDAGGEVEYTVPQWPSVMIDGIDELRRLLRM